MENENMESENNELCLEQLLLENYPKRVAEKVLEEFDELPVALTGMADAMDDCGDFYDYVKECIANNHTTPSAVDFCSRFIKDGKYTYEDVIEENYEDFINSEVLLGKVQA